MSGILAILFLLLAAPAGAAAQQKTASPQESGCRQSSGRYRRTFQHFVLLIAANPGNDEKPCRAQLRDSDGRLIFEAADVAVSLLDVEDINGDGQPDLAIEGFSGGAHCCWTYYYVSLGSIPGLVGKIANTHGIAVLPKAELKHAVLATDDSGFDNFDGLCYACSPSRAIYLVLNQDKFETAGRYFAAEYDKSIAEARAQLTPEKLAQFRQSDPAANANPTWELNDVKSAVLSIVLGYLYSARQDQAWKELENLWPAADQQRIKAGILKARSEGTLKSAAEWNLKH